MAQQTQPTTEGVDQSGMEDRATVTATVGAGRNATQEVPAEIGAFEHREVPYGEMTTWERIHQPREPGAYPYIAVRYGISCEGLDGVANGKFHITRRVISCSWLGRSTGLPHGTGSAAHHMEKTVSGRTIARRFETFESALSFAERLMLADSADPRLPPELSEDQRRAYVESEWEASA